MTRAQAAALRTALWRAEAERKVLEEEAAKPPVEKEAPRGDPVP